MDIKLMDMKRRLLAAIACLFAVTNWAQEVIVIDKNEQNKDIFNYNDPYSLVSLVKFNWIEEITPMDSNSVTHLKEIGMLESVYSFEEVYSPSPLLDEDPDSPNFGEPLTYLDPETGYITFVYPPPPISYYDVDGITRILIFKGEVQNPVTRERYEGIKEIGFAKKYGIDEKYTITMKIPFSYLMRMDGFKALVNLPEEVKDELADLTNERSLFNQIKKDRFAKRRHKVVFEPDTATKDVIKMEYFDPSFQIMSHGFSRFRLPTNSWGEKSKGYNPQGKATKHCFQLPFTSFNEKILADNFEVIDTTVYGRSPLLDEDPSSPNFGEPLTEEDENGNLTFVYPKESYTYYVDFEPKSAYVLLDFNYVDTQNKRNFGILPEQLLLTGAYEDKEHLIFNVYFFEENNRILDKRVELNKFDEFCASLPTYDTLNWRKLIVSQSNSTEGLIEVGSKIWNRQFN